MLIAFATVAVLSATAGLILDLEDARNTRRHQRYVQALCRGAA